MWNIAVFETEAVWCLSSDKMIPAPAYSWKCQMVIGQGWIAVKPEYCIRERQLVRSQNRLSYERGWVRRRRGGEDRREREREREVETGMESRGREWGAKRRTRRRSDTKKLIAWSRWGGGDHPKAFRQYLYRLLHLSEGVCVCERERELHAGPLRGQRKMLRLHSSSLCDGPTAACRHLASHWSLISTDREVEKSGALVSPSHRKNYTSSVIHSHCSLFFSSFLFWVTSLLSSCPSSLFLAFTLHSFKGKTKAQGAEPECDFFFSLSFFMRELVLSLPLH